jgi:large subunit GTPase 1
MPRQGGQGKGKPGRNEKHFGRALIKQQQQLNVFKLKEKKQDKLSVLENTAVEDFIAMAQIDEEGFEVKRVVDPAELVMDTTGAAHRAQKLTVEGFQQHQLVIPRKPKWTFKMSAEEVDTNEKKAFLMWRRTVAQIEANSNYTLKITPFEKNLEVWRQLWRVCDRSDLIVQVVDGRNPLMYFTADLKKYLTEMRPARPMLLLVNKSDLLSEYQRLQWAKHFRKLNVFFIFYSAHLSQEDIDQNQKCPPSLTPDELEALTSSFIQHWQEADAKGVREAAKKAKQAAKAAKANKKLAAAQKAAAAAAAAAEEDDEEDDEEEDEDNDEEDDEEGAEEEDEDDELDGLEEVSEDEEEEDEEAVSESDLQEGDEDNADILSSYSCRVFNRADLMMTFSALSSRVKAMRLAMPAESQDPAAVSANRDPKACVGMVGYPNVGKSSVINTLLGVAKSSHGKLRVAVSSTPGKTKHFQTLILSNDLMLCDCPGLVFPSVMRNAGEMLCAGILPINQMRNYVEPGNLIASRIPMHLLEAAYGIKIIRELDILDHPDRPPTASEVLGAYCKVKGYITGHTGRWDEFRACKEVLRDFNDGKILYVAMPPNGCDILRWLAETEQTMLRRSKIADRLHQRLAQQSQSDELHKQGVNLLAYGDSNQVNSLTGHKPAQVHTGLGGVEDDEDDEDEFEDVGDDDDEEGDEEVAASMQQLSMGKKSVGSVIGGVNGGVEYEFIAEGDDTAYEFFTEVTALDQANASNIGSDGRAKREHKRAKRWGKKQRKLRDKDPYREDIGPASYMVHFKNRNPVMQGSGYMMQGPK